MNGTFPKLVESLHKRTECNSKTKLHSEKHDKYKRENVYQIKEQETKPLNSLFVYIVRNQDIKPVNVSQSVVSWSLG